ncbi:hypothetical protein WJX73_007164 [Symbiochloris irregularis]|uniref:Fungal lipase-type domain-containing protein n=1 Tax=Symbiochloris irregularis TaxID=706552 RepID=A0AAW1PX58_9CHLO
MVQFGMTDWDPDRFKAETLSDWLQGPLAPVPWLEALAPEARVHGETLAMFTAISGDGLTLADAIKKLTDGVSPRIIKCVGFCVSGMLATVTALWAATEYPTAEVRCITFGAQKVGNSTFAQIFRWLVGLSFRMIYNRDPVPDNKRKSRNMLMTQDTLVHVHGEVYIDKAVCRPECRPENLTKDMADHCWLRYYEALDAHVDAECQRTLTTTSSGQAPADSQQQQQQACPYDLRHQETQAGGSSTSNATAADNGNHRDAEDSRSQLGDSKDESLSGQTEPPQADQQEQHRQYDTQASLSGGIDLGPTGTPGGDEKIAEACSKLGAILIAGKISQAAVLAAAAYKDEATFRHLSGIEKCRLVVAQDGSNTHVHIAWMDDGTAIFAFRGTATMQDGLADVKALRRDVHYLTELFPKARAHLGFMKQFVGVCRPKIAGSDLAAVLLELSGGREPTLVICTGHSLGGALATLGASWAALQWTNADVRCCTFGSPRVGNRSFKRAFHSLVGTSLRIVHGHDPVPVLPPSGMYNHVQGAIHITPAGVLKLAQRPWHYKDQKAEDESGALSMSDVQALHRLLLCDTIGDCASDENMDDLVQKGDGRGGLMSMLACMG